LVSITCKLAALATALAAADEKATRTKSAGDASQAREHP
jgi:hypothetical protein